MRGFLPTNLLAIRLRCGRCGEVSVTPGLPEGDILPATAIAIDPGQEPHPGTARLGPGNMLVGASAFADAARTRPNPPQGEVLLTRALLEAAAADYDRLTGGELATHMAVSPPPEGADHGRFPLAWAVLRLRDRVEAPGWSWTQHNDDAMAAMYVTALHDLMQCWGEHPLLLRLAPALAQPDGFIRGVTTLAMARLLFEAGNRVGFALSDDGVALRFTTPTDEPLSLALLAPEALQWRQRDQRSPQALRAAVIDAVGSVAAQVNRARPGAVMLAASILLPDFDQMVFEAVQSALQLIGRRHRGIAAVGVIMPKVWPPGPPNRIGFGYGFYPLPNPRFTGENPVRLGTRQEHAS